MKLISKRSREEHEKHQANGREYTPLGAVDTSRLPVNPTTQEPIPPMAQPGYYPGYSTLSQQAFWDDATRKVVLDRVNNVPPIRFFKPDEVQLMQAIIDRIIPQDDRDAAHKIPVLNYIDDRLYARRIDGYRYAKMPPDDEAIHLGMQAIQEIAQFLYQKPFTDLNMHEQDSVLKTIHDGKPPAGDEIWQRMPVERFWTLLVQDCARAYYAHPYAWDEIGFGGPAYPRGYMRLDHGKPEPWEKDEHRYDWEGPPGSLSVDYDPLGLEHGVKPQGQSGSH